MAEENFHNRGGHFPQHRPENFPGGPWTGQADAIGEAARTGVEQVEKMAKTFGELPTDFMKGLPGKDQRREEDDTSDKWIDDIANRPGNNDDDDSKMNDNQSRHRFPQEHLYKDYSKGGDSWSAKDDTKVAGKNIEDETSDKWIDDIANRPGNDDDEEDEEFEVNNGQRRPRFPQEDFYKDFSNGGDSGSTKNDTKAEGKNEDDTSDKWIDDVANRPGNDDEEEIDENNRQRRPRFPQEQLYKDYVQGGESGSTKGGTCRIWGRP